MKPKKMVASADMKNGSRFKTKNHGYAQVIDYYNTNTVIVFFENTGNIRAISAAKLRKGELIDRSVMSESIMVGKKIESEKYGLLTITEIESENIIVLTNEKGNKIRMLLSIVQKMMLKQNNNEKCHEEIKIPTSLCELTKRNKKTKDINKLLKKMLTDYGK